MTSVDNRPLRVFLCHSSNDKPAVRELYQKLRAEPWIEPWLDEEELYPGQDWNLEIEKAVEDADAIIVCLSKGSITKEGYVQRELRIVLDFADYKPEGTLYIIPVRLEECEPPRRLRSWQYADYFEGQRERAFQRLLVSLKRRADSLDLKIVIPKQKEEQRVDEEKKKVPRSANRKAEPNKINSAHQSSLIDKNEKTARKKQLEKNRYKFSLSFVLGLISLVLFFMSIKSSSYYSDYTKNEFMFWIEWLGSAIVSIAGVILASKEMKKDGKTENKLSEIGLFISLLVALTWLLLSLVFLIWDLFLN